MPKIYCAGPLFNNKEKEEMQEIASILESRGYEVFLPQRDGFEFFNLFSAFTNLGVSESVARRILNKAIFTLDVFQVLSSHGLVLNINGRVPDEGAIVEAGIAWSSGKKIVIYKNDARTLLNGNDNPLLVGLTDFKVVNSIKDLPQAFNGIQVNAANGSSGIDTTVLNTLYEKGKQIASLASEKMDYALICQKLMEVLEDSNELE
jgi:nucleoside 2-deoxyribosyltransferase